MGDVDLAEDAVAIVGDDDAAHGVQQHFEHGPRAQRGADDVRDATGGGDVAELRLAAVLAVRLGVCVGVGWKWGEWNWKWKWKWGDRDGARSWARRPMRKEKDGARECGLWGGDKTTDEHEGGREEGEGKGGPSRRAKQAEGGRASAAAMAICQLFFKIESSPPPPPRHRGAKPNPTRVDTHSGP